MKQVCFYLLLIIVNVGYSQNTFSKAVYAHKYDLPNASQDTLRNDLYFNNSGESYYISLNPIVMSRKNSIEQKEPTRQTRRIDTTLIYRNILTRQHYYNKLSFGTQHLISDSLKDISWKLNLDTKVIGKFKCKSASAKVYGRNYQVWYAPEIPVSTGPWKLFGLPGLIVEVRDDLGLIYIGLESIKTNDSYKVSYNLEKLSQKAITLESFKKKEQENLDKLNSYGKSMGVTVTRKVSSKGLELEEN